MTSCKTCFDDCVLWCEAKLGKIRSLLVRYWAESLKGGVPTLEALKIQGEILSLKTELTKLELFSTTTWGVIPTKLRSIREEVTSHQNTLSRITPKD